MVKEFNKSNFKTEVLESNIPVLIDLWAPWCPPCRIVSPVVEELSQEYEGRLKVGKVNVDQEPDIAAQYSVQSIPTLLFFKNGKVVDSIIGAVPKEYLSERIEKILKE